MHDKKGLSNRAYDPLPDGESYTPYVSAREGVLAITAKAVIPGILFGIIFGVARRRMTRGCLKTVQPMSLPEM